MSHISAKRKKRETEKDRRIYKEHSPHLEGRAHALCVSCAIKGVVNAPLRHVAHKHVLQRLVVVVWVHKVCCSELARNLLLAVVGIDCKDARSLPTHEDDA